MKVSLNEIKKLVNIPEKMSTEELIKLIGSRLVEVEGKDDWSEKYRGILIVKVEKCEEIPDTHLHLCQINVGKKELVQVVCGAPNVRGGMFAAWVAPGAKLPADPSFTLGVRKLRGYESNGMLAAEDELGLGAGHDGIIEIDPERVGVKPGASFAEVFDLDDVILDIENKSLTHRPDCFGIIGFAREVAGILGEKFIEPKIPEIAAKKSKIKVKIEDAELCKRYECAVFEVDNTLGNEKYFSDDAVFLAKAGMRSVSEIVDATNVVMLMTGQPLHAFDYDKFVKIGGENVGVRTAKKGEKLTLLDDSEINLTENDIVITSGETAVALAGAMGGKSTEIDAETKNVMLEAATFSLYNLRKTQMDHGIFSEAITRFTKGQPKSGTEVGLRMALAKLGVSESEIQDCQVEKDEKITIKLSIKDINSLLGTDYDLGTVKQTLENVGFKTKGNLEVVTPDWRTDIHIREDIIEEVGRLLGFDNIMPTLPLRPFIGARKPELRILKTRIREILSDQLRANELLTYSFVSERLQKKVGENPENSYKIVNSISPELQRFRQSITPSLLVKARDNLKYGYNGFSLYEINQVARKNDGLDEDGVPIIREELSFLVLGDYYRAKAGAEFLLNRLGVSDYTLNAAEKSPGYFEIKHSADIATEKVIGRVGEIKRSVLRELKIDAPVAVIEIGMEKLLGALPKSEKKNLEFSKFPAVVRDITIRVSSELSYQNIFTKLNEALATKELVFSVRPLSIYQRELKMKNVSFRLTFADKNGTLTEKEIFDIMASIKNIVKREFSGEII
ncbi:MAG: phenylalanine--tRNA ligase subunit beta [Candidatus Saccharibacteria bacterium]|nr:phenylalanine--tRNA ligase subunit beta [Candidatus Saccharibacteria bacterium]